MFLAWFTLSVTATEWLQEDAGICKNPVHTNVEKTSGTEIDLQRRGRGMYLTTIAVQLPYATLAEPSEVLSHLDTIVGYELDSQINRHEQALFLFSYYWKNKNKQRQWRTTHPRHCGQSCQTHGQGCLQQPAHHSSAWRYRWPHWFHRCRPCRRPSGSLQEQWRPSGSKHT